MTDALRYLLARRLPAPRPWELATLALCCSLPSALLALLAPESLPDVQVVVRGGALVALPLYWIARTTGLGVAMRRGGSLDEVYGAGLGAGDLLAGLSLLGAGRAASSALACALGLAAGALLLPPDLSTSFLLAAGQVPVVAALAAVVGIGLGLIPVLAGVRRPVTSRVVTSPRSGEENPVLFREGLRPPSAVPVMAAGFAAGALGLMVLGFWGGLAALWLVLVTATALRSSAAFALERETRSLEALFVTRTDLDEFLDGWVRASISPLRALGWLALAAPFVGLLDPERVLGDSPMFGSGDPPAGLLAPSLAIALAAVVGWLAPRAGAWLGLWASAGAPDRSQARGRLVGGLLAVLGATLLLWALLVFPTGIAMERLDPPSFLERLWETAALLLFPLLSAVSVLGALALRSRPAVTSLVESAWRGGAAPAPVRGLRAWIGGALSTLWTPGRLLLVPAASAALVLIWRDNGSRGDLGEAAFMMLLMAGLGLFSSGTLWLVLWKPTTWAWEAMGRRGWPLGRTLLLGLVAGTVASASVVGGLLALSDNSYQQPQWLLLGPVLGMVLTLREWLAKR